MAKTYKTKNLHFKSNFKGEKKKKIREIIEKCIQNRKKQIAVMEGLIEPLRNDIKLCKDFLKNEVSLERLSHHQKAVNRYLKKFIGKIK